LIIHTAGEQVASLLREKILNGEIPDDTELTQKMIAGQLGVSRMPIREALAKLEFEGLIERLDNRHTRVIGVDGRMLSSRFRFMASLESDAAVSVSESEDYLSRIAQLRDFCRNEGPMDEALNFHNRLFFLADDRFYFQIYRRMVEPQLSAFLQRAGAQAEFQGRLVKGIVSAMETQSPATIRQTVDEYFRVLITQVRLKR
jgi:DNA-binding GntR family transcriptional regulator